MTDEQLMLFFQNNADIFVNNSIPAMALRYIGWWLFKGLVWIADKAEGLYDISFGLVDFTSWSSVNQFVAQFKPVFIGLMAVSLFALGIMMIMGREKKPKVLQNICIAVLCITCSTVVFQQMNSLVIDMKQGIESIEIGEESFGGVYDIVGNNLIDLVYLDNKIGMKNINYEKNKDTLPTPKITEKNFKYIDYTEVLNPKTDYGWSKNGDAETILQKKLYLIAEGSWGTSFKICDVYNGFGWNSADDTDVGNEFYYRYHFSFFTATLLILAIAILYIAMSYKCVRIIYELVVARLLAYLYSAEVSGGEKIGKVLTFIRDSYILLLITTICIRLFYLFTAFIQKNVGNTFAEGVLIIFAAFCLIDGPNLVEKLIGMDAGLSSSTARMMAAAQAARSIMHTAAAPFKFAAHQVEKGRFYSRMEKAAQNNSNSTNNAAGNDIFSDNNGADGSHSVDDAPGSNASADNIEGQDSSGQDVHGNSASMDSSYQQDTSFMDNQGTSSVENGFDSGFMDSQSENGAMDGFADSGLMDNPSSVSEAFDDNFNGAGSFERTDTGRQDTADRMFGGNNTPTKDRMHGTDSAVRGDSGSKSGRSANDAYNFDSGFMDVTKDTRPGLKTSFTDRSSSFTSDIFRSGKNDGDKK